MTTHHVRSRSAFSIIELLIVLAILAVLISILLPSVSRARESAQRVVCTANLRSLGQAFFAFANDHDGYMPGGHYDSANPDATKTDWARGSKTTYLDAPQNGTIFPYVNKNYGVYRCPSLAVEQPGSGAGSNGRFDYTMPVAFAGARRAVLPPECRFTYPDGTTITMPTPLLIEEDPAKHMNSLSMEASWGSTDEFTKTHAGGGQYAAIDGSVSYFKAPAGTNTSNWTCKGRNAQWISVGKDVKWGWWDGK